MFWLLFPSVFILTALQLTEAATVRPTTFPPPQPPAGCAINMTALNPEPIIVYPNNTFIYPTRENNNLTIILPGSSIIASCPGSRFAANLLVNASVEARCSLVPGTNNNYNFEIIGNQGVQRLDNVSYFQCLNNVTSSTKTFNRTTSCPRGTNEIEIGFELRPDRFVRQILICFDNVTFSTNYSTFTLTRSIGSIRDKPSPSPPFLDGNFHNSTDVNQLYRQQNVTINTQLGLGPNDTTYLRDRNLYFLTRGHLTANADFLFVTQRNATFNYVNTAPQWQIINANSWAAVETSVRNYASAYGDLQVYTGTFGITTLPHSSTRQNIALYLYVNKATNRKALPVPQWFWKVVYDANTKQGVAIIGSNNPHATTAEIERAKICGPDISPQLQWLQATNPAMFNTSGYGLIYTCSVQNFRYNVTYLPQFTVTGLLNRNIPRTQPNVNVEDDHNDYW